MFRVTATPALALLIGLSGCGGASYDAWATVESGSAGDGVSGGADRDYRPGATGASIQIDAASRPGGLAEQRRRAPEVRRDRAMAPADSARRERYAQADVSGDPPTATDGRSGPLLVYTAEAHLAVHQVTAQQARIEALAREAGGHLDRRTDDRIRVRVPADAFHEVFAAILELGDVLSRDVSVQDVTEEFRDVELRIRTLEAMHQRVQRLLEEAEGVEAALAIEQHLERITLQLETLRGRLRFMADRVAFSTITITFRERAAESEPSFELPFLWLRSLGLPNLMRLR